MGKSNLSDDAAGYLDVLKERAKVSRVYKKHQMTGLMISQILGDEKYKSLYIKLAKENNQDKLLALAKDIGLRKNVKNKGAYFMRVLYLMRHRGIRTNADFSTRKKKTRKTNGKRTKNNNHQ